MPKSKRNNTEKTCVYKVMTSLCDKWIATSTFSAKERPMKL